MQDRRPHFHRAGLFVVALAAFIAAVAPASARGDEAMWRALGEGGVVVVMRHARAPGVGDPGNLRLGDCSTQRNLSDEGRAQARAIGAAFGERGVAVERVMSSEWCRCLDTARLLGLGDVEPFPPLNSFFRDRHREAGQIAVLAPWVASQTGGGVVVLVTHQVVVTALTGVFPASGEMVVVRPLGGDRIEVLGTIAPPP